MTRDPIQTLKLVWRPRPAPPATPGLVRQADELEAFVFADGRAVRIDSALALSMERAGVHSEVEDR